MFCLILEDTCTGICEEVHSSCDAVYEVPYSSPSSEDHGQLMVTNFRVTFVPYQSTNTEPVGCAVCSFFNTYIVIAVVSAANIRSYQEFWASCGKCSKYFTDTIESRSCQSYVKRGGGGRFSEGPFVLGTLSGVAYLSVCGGVGHLSGGGICSTCNKLIHSLTCCVIVQNYSKTSLTRTRLTQTLGLHGRIFLARSKVLGFI